jgi:hypothetical protein
VSHRRCGIFRNGVEIQSEICEEFRSLAGPRRVGLWGAGLQAQVSDFRVAPRCVAASLVAKTWVGPEKLGFSGAGIFGGDTSFRYCI